MFKKRELSVLLVILLTGLLLIGCGGSDSNEELETGLDDAKTFVADSKGHGINLADAGFDQAKSMDAHFEEDVIPYMKAVGYRLKHIDYVMMVWINEEVMFAPGEYTLEWVEGLYEKDGETYEYEGYKTVEEESYPEDPPEEGNWEWTFNFKDNDQTVSIEISNINKFMQFDKEGNLKNIDLTEAHFSYLHTDKSDPDFERSFSGELSTEVEETIDLPEEEYTATLPRKAVWSMSGKMTDNLVLEEGQPAIGVVNLNNFDYSLDLANDNLISFTGNIEAEEFNYYGSSEMRFDNFPDYQDIIVSEKLPQLAEMSAEGKFSTEKLILDGSYSIDFAPVDYKIIDEETEEEEIITKSLPKEINYAGSFENTADYFKFAGDVSLNTDYDGLVLGAGFKEDENNFVPLGAELDIILDSKQFAQVGLNVGLKRTGLAGFESDFRYDYQNNKYIRGTANIGAGVFGITAQNELGIRIVIDEEKMEEIEDGMIVGEITDVDYEPYGDIRIVDGQPQVEFRDGETIELLAAFEDIE